MILARRHFLTGLAAFLAAPAVVRAENLMPIRALAAEPVVFIPTSSYYLLRDNGVVSAIARRRRCGVFIRISVSVPGDKPTVMIEAEPLRC